MSRTRIGIDFGGTKVEIAALDAGGQEVVRRRIPSPAAGGRAEYDRGVRDVADLVRGVEATLGETASIGVGIPGVISPATGLVKNANSICLNGHAFDRDLAAALGRPVRVENDANCFALSEALDGAGRGHRMVFGVILGTGVGGGIVLDGRIWPGRNRVAGEWGHNPLPWPEPAELPGNRCWCGQSGCMETWVAGPALALDCDGPGHRDASGIPARAAAGETRAAAALERHASRLARGLATIINALDPDVIVLGGGLSNMDHLYARVPALIPRWLFTDVADTPVVRNRHGDSSGVRGAAWLWPATD
jgi:fructokinase